jgi:hypothetical protein
MAVKAHRRARCVVDGDRHGLDAVCAALFGDQPASVGRPVVVRVEHQERPAAVPAGSVARARRAASARDGILHDAIILAPSRDGNGPFMID